MTGVSLPGASISTSESDLPFTTDAPKNAGSFVGHGLAFSGGVGFKGAGVALTSFGLGDGISYASANPSSGTAIDKGKGLSGSTGGIDWTLEDAATPTLLDARGNLLSTACTTVVQ
jgi:hypothetical protein